MPSRRSFLFALTAFAFVPLGATAANFPDLKGRTVIVVTGHAYPPLQFFQPRPARPIGREYDAMDEIAKRLNFRVEYRNTVWDAMIRLVSEGQYDIGMTKITVQDGWKQKVDFSDPYMRTQYFMLVRGNEKRFDDAKSFGSIRNGLIGIPAGTTPFYTAAYPALDDKEHSPRFEEFKRFDAMVQTLKAGDIDAVLTDGDTGKRYVDASNGDLKLIDGPLGAEDLGFVFAKGSDLVAPVNAAIAALKADGTFEALSQKWFAEYTNHQ